MHTSLNYMKYICTPLIFPVFQSQPPSSQECIHAFNPLLWILHPRQLVLEYSVIGEFQDVDAKYKIQLGEKRKHQWRRTVKPEDSQLGPRMALILRTSMWLQAQRKLQSSKSDWVLFMVVYT